MIDERDRNYSQPLLPSTDQKLEQLFTKCAELLEYCDNLEERIEKLESETGL